MVSGDTLQPHTDAVALSLLVTLVANSLRNLLCLSFKSLFIVDVIGHMDINLLISLDGNGKLWIW